MTLIPLTNADDIEARVNSLCRFHGSPSAALKRHQAYANTSFGKAVLKNPKDRQTWMVVGLRLLELAQ